MNSNVTKNDFYGDLQEARKFRQLEQRLLGDSNLPGPRANLGAASAFADAFGSDWVTGEAWELLVKWSGKTESDAPTDDPREFLPFCALQAMGTYYCYAEPSRQQLILERCQAAMNDSRWRMREAAAMALQRIGEQDFGALRSLIDAMKGTANALEKRAFVAALAHPSMLKDSTHVLYALELSEEILDEIAAGQTHYGAEDFRVLSKGLEYALSVFVERAPEVGFRLLAKFAVTDDKRMQKIVKTNLGKARLAKKFSQDVERIQLMMNA
ncbi:HEAT repeat domain-containing protein [Paenibacillus sp. CN-4]|uniref:HEAT repeat domain-containing protein n=1 Tax=Paenibacillus nanchangensis TaxID=3348343 RepID=UPI003978F99A